MSSTRYSCQILMKLEFFSIDFLKKFLNTKFHENPSNGNRVSIVRPARDRQMSVELKEMYREKLKY